MPQLRSFLKDLISAPGLSGYETPIREMIIEAWQPLTDQIHTSQLGSLHALKQGHISLDAEGQEQPQVPSLLIAAHMDAIGLMVTRINQGLLNITGIGGLDARVLPGQPVIVHGRKDIPAVIVQPPAHLLPESLGSGPIPLEYLLVDPGIAPRQVEELVRAGDLVSFAQPVLEMGENILAGHSLDNRASVAALTHCLQILADRKLEWDVWAVATAQEEETLAGALTSAYQLRPSIAVAVDVTFGSSPGTPDHESFALAEGPTLGWGPNIHPRLHRTFKELADRLEIPNSLEALPRHSGTDAIALQIAAEGVPTMVISIPLRYMHTPVEMVSMKDIKRTGRLLAEFAAQLNESFMEKLSWDDDH